MYFANARYYYYYSLICCLNVLFVGMLTHIYSLVGKI